MKKKEVLKTRRNLVLLGLCVAGFTLCTGCKGTSDMVASGSVAAEDAANYYSTDSYLDYEEYDAGIYEELADAPNGSANAGSTAVTENVATNRKLIKTVELDVETENFADMIDRVEDRTNTLGGYISDSYVYNGSKYTGGKVYKTADITIRIPESKLDLFVEEIGDFSNVVEKTVNTEDVTLQYVDTEGKKAMYRAEEESLLALLENAEELEDITYLTSRLAEVRYMIESTESTLRTYDNLVDYATIHLSVEEVEILTEIIEEEPGFWEELGADFMESLENIGAFFVGLFRLFVVMLPYLFVLAVFAGIIVLAIRILIAIMKKSETKKRAKYEAQIAARRAEDEKARQEREAQQKERESQGKEEKKNPESDDTKK